MKNMVFGLGTGRCGTVSLTKIINLQPGFKADHEKIITPWKVNLSYIDKTISVIQTYNADVVCDISFWHLPYVDYIIDRYPQTKFVCLKRDKTATVNSYNHKTSFNPVNGLGERNHWTTRDSVHWVPDKWRIDSIYDPCYPKYDLPRIEAISQYWEDYYSISKEYEDKYSKNFRVYNTEEVLNNELIQQNMLEFIGVPENKVIIKTNVKENRSK